MKRARVACVALFFCSLLAGCGSNTTPTFRPLAQPTSAPLGPNAIKHVVIIVQENRSFDNLFNGFPGADTAQAGLKHDGTTVRLSPVTLEDGKDTGHFHYSFELAYHNGKLDGFDLEQSYGIVKGVYQVVPGSPDYPYSYVPQSETLPYWTLASNYVVADRNFQSNSGPSYPAHQYLIAGQSQLADEVPSVAPWGCDAPAGTLVPQLAPDGSDTLGVFPCFDYRTIGDELDAAGISWRYYAPALKTQSGSQFTAYDAIRHIRYGTDWASDIVSPETTVLGDAASGNLPAVSWVIPSFPNSDHPLAGSDTGPSWVASVVNAIGSGPDWNTTAIFIVWDDWGGWYDHVPPPQLDAMGLGFRVPLIVVSPYAKRGYVSHVTHEFGSVLHFTEEVFGLPSLGNADARADDLSDCFDFSQPARAFSAVRTRYHAQDFLHQTPSEEPPDPI